MQHVAVLRWLKNHYVVLKVEANIAQHTDEHLFADRMVIYTPNQKNQNLVKLRLHPEDCAT